MVVCSKCQAENQYDSSYMSHGGHKCLTCKYCKETKEYWYSSWHGWQLVEDEDE